MQYSYDSNEDCYRINVGDVYQKLSRHQMKQYHLFGKPIHAQLLVADSPK